jgi:TPP-dependent trihydroxycyclohexane-1,2-dione (THcHDO) dehydratase
VIETIAGRANLLAGHPLNIGPVGVTGSDSANAIAEKADVILAVGTGCRISPPGRGRPSTRREAHLAQCRAP